jgi:hypothetical protein
MAKKISDNDYVALVAGKLEAPTFIACALAKHGRNFKAISQEVAGASTTRPIARPTPPILSFTLPLTQMLGLLFFKTFIPSICCPRACPQTT